MILVWRAPALLVDVMLLGFEDVIYFDKDGRLINDAVVTRFGIPVARVRFEMQPA